MYEIKSILVPISFAPSCGKALEVAARLALANKAKIYVLNVYKTPMSLFYSFGGALYAKSVDAERAENIERLDRFVKNELKRLRLKLQVEELEIEDTRPEDAIIKIATDKNIDLIVLGHHEESRLEHLLFGRNVNKIIDKAPCDVIVTRTLLFKKRRAELAA